MSCWAFVATPSFARTALFLGRAAAHAGLVAYVAREAGVDEWFPRDARKRGLSRDPTRETPREPPSKRGEQASEPEPAADAKALLAPVALGDLQLPSRVVHAALSAGRSPDGMIGPVSQQYYQQRAGCGMLITEPAAVQPAGLGAKDAPGLYSEEHSQAWYGVTSRCKADGCKVVCSLWHAGRLSHPSLHGEPVVAPSAVKAEACPVPRGPVPLEGVLCAEGLRSHVAPAAMSEAEVAAVVEAFGASARLAVMAGFDGIEIHAGWGGLIDTFLQSSTNHRSDAYGGTWQKRFQLLFEVLQRVAMELPLSKVGVRVSPNSGFNGMGSADNFICFPKFAELLRGLGVAYLHVQDTPRPPYPGMCFHNKCAPVTLQKLAKCAPPLVCAGGSEPAEVAAKIASGHAQAAAFGRLSLANPDLCQRIRDGRALARPPSGNPEAALPEGDDLAKGYTDYPDCSLP